VIEPGPHCITCSDEGAEMRVLELDQARGLALCSRADGQRATVEIALLEEVGVGDLVLVHADVALTSLERAR
jgi:hydrogenase expression/formation protein HypC